MENETSGRKTMGTNREQKSLNWLREPMSHCNQLICDTTYNYQLFTWSPDQKRKRKS